MDQIFGKYKKLIDQEIDRVAVDLQKINLDWVDQVTQSLAVSAKLGKTVRGSLVLLTLEIFKKKIDQDSLKVAAAIEYLHTALLIHDDIMDHDDKRRGQPSMYKQYQAVGENLQVKDPLDFGTSLAICIGDIAIFTAWWVLSKLESIPADNQQQLLKLFSQEFLRVGFGQIQDVAFGHVPSPAALDEVLAMYTNKTARYTFSLPLLIGGILSQQTDNILKILDDLGLSLGLIFQLTDDHLTLNGQASQVGKNIGNDIKANKQTYYHLLLKSRLNQQEADSLANIFGNPQASQTDLDLVREFIIKYQIDQAITDKIEEYAKQAKQLIKKLPIEMIFQQQLEQLVVYLINRQK